MTEHTMVRMLMVSYRNVNNLTKYNLYFNTSFKILHRMVGFLNEFMKLITHKYRIYGTVYT